LRLLSPQHVAQLSHGRDDDTAGNAAPGKLNYSDDRRIQVSETAPESH